VTAAQAFHWFDIERARAEFRRILRPGGRVALVWNNRLEHTPFLRDYEGLLHEFGIDYAAVMHRGAAVGGSIARFFGAGGFESRGFENRQVMDFAGLRGLAQSASYLPRPDQAGFEAMIDTLWRLFAKHVAGGTVVMEYETRIYVGQLMG